MTKKYMSTDSFSAIAHVQKPPITESSENVPDFRYSAYGPNSLNKTFQVIIFEKKNP